MKDIRIPGVVWAILLVTAAALLHENQEALPFDPAIFDLIIVVIIGILKSLNLGTGQLDQALDIIDQIRRSAAATRSRGTSDGPAGLEAPVLPAAEAVPERPNAVARWLVG